MPRIKMRFLLGVASVEILCLLATVNLRADPKPLGLFSGITPTTGPAVVDSPPSADEQREKIEAFWDQQNGGNENGPHPRWENRQGAIVATPIAATNPSETDALISPTLVSVHLKHISTRRALGAFEKQTGIKLSLFPAEYWRGRRFPPITLDADQKPLLEVVNEMMCAGGFSLYDPQIMGNSPPAPDPAHPRVLLGVQENDQSLGQWEVSGPFAFEIQQISHVILLEDPATNAGPVSFAIRMEHEPKINVLAQQAFPDVVEAVDEKGNEMSPQAAAKPRIIRHGLWADLLSGPAPKIAPTQGVAWAGLNQPLMVNLQAPADPGKTLVKFRARAKFLLQLKSQQIEVAISKEKPIVEQVIDGVKCSIGPLNVMPQQATCTVSFSRSGLSEAEWQDRAAALAGLEPDLIDDRGRIVPNRQRQMSQNRGNSVVSQFFWWIQPQEDGQSSINITKLVLEVPTQMTTVEVPIEFDNLPLP